MKQKKIIAMLLAGGQGSRLGILTRHVAKPAIAFGGKYKIIDFTLSNCINSGIDTVGVLTQYQPLKLNGHIGIGIPWDLDKNYGGVSVLPPYIKDKEGTWYSGTANAIYQNIHFIDYYQPEYVIVLSGDHIYKMDYEKMLHEHIENEADATIAVLQVPIEEAHRFGIMNTDENQRIVAFDEKPKEPKSDLASMGIYIFSWKVLREAITVTDEMYPNNDFGKHVIPHLLKEGFRLYAYQFDGFWKDVGTLHAYWEANMELIKLIPDFNLYEVYWKIYTKNEILPPQYIAEQAVIETCIIGEGSQIEGEIYNSVIGSNVCIGKGTVIIDSIIMSDTTIGDDCHIYKSIISEETDIGSQVAIGEGENIISEAYPELYHTGITVIGERTSIPDGISIGKNCALYGTLTEDDFQNNELLSGGSIIKEGAK
ncbi:glucose-1-phosphate adenylyltransferase [Vallitalea pronyensis]|uniref:Glucose-1-phosphate adenylyltransferase n=1 Tax=Vallitalea pronyensis TaxID=1348613 RepID=A0A8J8MFW2_9FIRM|nr:glucose-1-phosphate adenylyltransferase [Vallitalea pronyensis]QUI20835.1 glucose-1-phosphate adenylyltransferase [Vallitalea pronyensis]